jgi:phenylalanyl-tRNA synthetase beta chain
LEAASFSHINNRRTSQALKLSSEASARFGRGVPASLTVPAAKRATDLMRQLGGGTIAKGVVDVYPVKQEKKVVKITAHEVERITGIGIGDEGIVEILESLDFRCKKMRESFPPSFRITGWTSTFPPTLWKRWLGFMVTIESPPH